MGRLAVLLEVLIEDGAPGHVAAAARFHRELDLLDEEVEQTAIHELVHCMNACLWESLPDKYQNSHSKLNELATENVARLITHLYKEKNA